MKLNVLYQLEAEIAMSISGRLSILEDTAGEIQKLIHSSHLFDKAYESRSTRLGTRDGVQPGRNPRDVEGGSCEDLLQMDLCQTQIPCSSYVKGANGLGKGALNSSSLVIGGFELWRGFSKARGL